MSTQTTTVACGNQIHRSRSEAYGLEPRAQHHHLTTVEVRRCFADPRGLQSLEEVEAAMLAEQRGDAYEFDADAAYECHLENAGFHAARDEEEREAAMGILSYEEARDAAAAQAQDCCDGTGWTGNPRERCVEHYVLEEPALAKVVRDGLYTVEAPEGHRTFRLRTQDQDAKFAPGQQIIAYLAGPDNTSDYVGFGFVVDGALRVWKKHQGNESLRQDAQALLANPDAALKAVHCYRCHRVLTTPESIAEDIGPDCAGRE